MSNYSKEKVLEWVNSSEARAAKYEQEAKDLGRKIQRLQERLETCNQELDEKIQLEGEVEAQEDVMQLPSSRRGRECCSYRTEMTRNWVCLYSPFNNLIIHPNYFRKSRKNGNSTIYSQRKFPE